MGATEIEGIRELLASKPRPTGWAERRRRLDEVGSTWPVADDGMLQTVEALAHAGAFMLRPA
jgi:hypothetical protein